MNIRARVRHGRKTDRRDCPWQGRGLRYHEAAGACRKVAPRVRTLPTEGSVVAQAVARADPAQGYWLHIFVRAGISTAVPGRGKLPTTAIGSVQLEEKAKRELPINQETTGESMSRVVQGRPFCPVSLGARGPVVEVTLTDTGVTIQSESGSIVGETKRGASNRPGRPASNRAFDLCERPNACVIRGWSQALLSPEVGQAYSCPLEFWRVHRLAAPLEGKGKHRRRWGESVCRHERRHS